MKKLLTLLFPVSLAACGTYYKNPQEHEGFTATIQSTNRRTSMFDWANFTVESVDNLPIDYSTSLMYRSKKVVVTKGVHNVVIAGSFNQAMGGGGPYQARCDIDMKFLGGRSYVANGMRKGSKLSMWIEDATTGKISSPAVIVPFNNESHNTYYPIFIPSN